jgi:hypothetical protein
MMRLINHLKPQGNSVGLLQQVQGSHPHRTCLAGTLLLHCANSACMARNHVKAQLAEQVLQADSSVKQLSQSADLLAAS